MSLRIWLGVVGAFHREAICDLADGTRSTFRPMESANEILPRGRVDAGFATDARVDARQQCCGTLDSVEYTQREKSNRDVVGH